MRFLVDANLSPRVATLLSGEGFESIHVGDVDLLTATDQAILDYAAANGLVIISADSDFGELLAVSRVAGSGYVRYPSWAPNDLGRCRSLVRPVVSPVPSALLRASQCLTASRDALPVSGTIPSVLVG